MVEGFVGRYALKPGEKLGLASERRQRMPDLYEYVLKEVVSVFVRAKELPDMMIEPFGIVVDYRSEGLLIRSVAD